MNPVRPSPARIAACAVEVAPGGASVRIFPAGKFDAPRGSMAGTGPWFMDKHLAGKLTARAAARGLQIPIDYEHQSLLAETNGQPAPAAGWINEQLFVWQPDEPGVDAPGLYAAVSWTPRARAMIETGEYRYLSPVFEYDPETGAVLELLSVALTNTPAMDKPLYAALCARHSSHPQEHPVNETLKKLLAALGLPETTAEADAITAVAALKTQAAQAQTQIAALKAAPPDPAKYVPIETMTALQGELAAARASVADDEAARIINQAFADGKLIEAQRAWATDLGKTNLAALKTWAASAPPIAALSGMQTQGRKDTPAAPIPSADERTVMAAMGLTAEEFAKGRKA
ncbi:MAG: phage protease [Azoarcus sp.]|nr:phage protease [Azoarcus sp.]